jgi:hypothetical protein
VTHVGDKINAYRFLVGKPEGKRVIGGPRCRRRDCIQMNLKEKGRKNVNWNHLAEVLDNWQALERCVL